MNLYNSSIVKAIEPNGNVAYYGSLADCRKEYGIRYDALLVKLIEQGGLAPDGKTFFDWPTDYELEEIAQNRITLSTTGRREQQENEN